MQSGFNEYLFSLYQTHSKELTAFAFYMLHNEDDAIDSVQQVFRQILEKQKQIKIPLNNARAFLYKSVKNICINTNIRKQREANFGKSMSIHTNEIFQMENQIDDRILISDIINHIENNFSEIEKTLFCLKFIENLKLEDISIIIDTSIPTVSRILKKITGELKNKFYNTNF